MGAAIAEVGSRLEIWFTFTQATPEDIANSGFSDWANVWTGKSEAPLEKALHHLFHDSKVSINLHDHAGAGAAILPLTRANLHRSLTPSMRSCRTFKSNGSCGNSSHEGSLCTFDDSGESSERQTRVLISGPPSWSTYVHNGLLAAADQLEASVEEGFAENLRRTICKLD